MNLIHWDGPQAVALMQHSLVFVKDAVLAYKFSRLYVDLFYDVVCYGRDAAIGLLEDYLRMDEI